jgi:hypothetical protein
VPLLANNGIFKLKDAEFLANQRIAGRVAAQALQLLSDLSDVQLEEVLPGAPWADGTVGGVLAANADHGRMHWKWVRDARLHSH